jgi:ADP-heptose:LPS heptosyltransferase
VLAQRPGVKVLAFVEPRVHPASRFPLPASRLEGYGDAVTRVDGVIPAKVDLRELIALIQRCDVLVCNDSGPMHIAGALGVPTVAMFGAEIEHWFSPLGDGHEILRPDNDKHQVEAIPGRQRIREPAGIKISQVLDAVGRTVQRARARGTFSRV